MRLTAFLFIVLCTGFFSHAQNLPQQLNTGEQLLSYVNTVYGSDDMLVSGRFYVPMHSLAEGHPYFNIEDWVIGKVFIKGTGFSDVNLKYDIELDEFVLFNESQDRKNYIVLNKHYVDSVTMGRFVFVNTTSLPEIGEDIGYAELVYDRDFLFLVKYKKDFKKEYSESKPYGEYNRQTNNRYLFENKTLVKLNTRKSLLAYFAGEKRDIKRYMKRNNIRYKKANSGELFNLLSFCSDVRQK